MTIINFSHSFVFVHVPKAAGTSVSTTLSSYTKYCDLEVGGTAWESKIGSYYLRFGLGKHSTAEELCKLMGKETWDRMYRFAFVRNPIPRAHSIFRFLKFVHRDWKGREVMDNLNTFEKFLESDFFQTDGPDRIFKRQCFWLGSKEILVNKIGRVENIQADMNEIICRIEGGSVKDLGDKPATLELAHKNVSPPAEENDITDRCLEIIHKRYEEDFRCFGYEYR